MEFQKMKDLRIVPPEELPRTCGLSTMLEKQKELNESIYPIVLKNLRLSNLEELENYSIEEIISKHKESLTKEYLLAIIREACEALDMINSKSWKTTKKEVDEIELKYEIIDVQHFVNSLYDIWKMDRNEIMGIFMAKYQENKRRVENGY